MVKIVFLIYLLSDLLFKTEGEILGAAPFSIKNRVRDDGYILETHFVQTEDDYILQLHRIPGRLGETVQPNRKVAFLQHGLLCSSTVWILLGPLKALAYLLSNAGYDVWLGNSRGNTYSRNHTVLDPDDDEEFWYFDWHEIGIYDLPACLDYILSETNKTQLTFVGHSQGGAVFNVLTSVRPEYNAKIQVAVLLAPATWLYHATSLPLLVLAPLVNQESYLRSLLGGYEFLPGGVLYDFIGQDVCADTSPIQALCSSAYYLFFGYNPSALNESLLPDIFSTTPAGASSNQIIHFAQSKEYNTFSWWNYGLLNPLYYKSSFPPAYDLQKVTVPVLLYCGENDILVDKRDCVTLKNHLTSNTVEYNLISLYSHSDFIFGDNADVVLYSSVIEKLESYQ